MSVNWNKVCKRLIATGCALSPFVFTINGHSYFSRHRRESNKPEATIPWDRNWDENEPEYQCWLQFKRRRKRKDVCDAEKHIFLIRHGQTYEATEGQNENELGLSPTGIKQAEMVGQKLLSYNISFHGIFYADNSKRSIETAKSIRNLFGNRIPSQSSSLLRNTYPIYPIPTETNWLPLESDEYDVDEDSDLMEGAFRHFFFRPSCTGKCPNGPCDIIVTSSNVIRYFVCRALQFPPEAWRRFSLHNCSITWIKIEVDGRVTLMCFGDFGHLPADDLTM